MLHVLLIRACALLMFLSVSTLVVVAVDCSLTMLYVCVYLGPMCNINMHMGAIDNMFVLASMSY